MSVAATGLDFAPAGVPAPRHRQVLAHATTEASLILRNGEQTLLALVIPIGFLVAGRWFGEYLGQPFATTVASVLALAVWSSCFTSLAIATGFERRYNVLERVAATPLGKSGILFGKAIGIGLVTLAQVAVLVAVALALGWRPGINVAHLVVALAAAVLAMGAFAGLALAIAGTARPEVTLGLANLIYLIGMVAGAILLPVARYPSWAQPVVGALPTAALGEAMRSGTSQALAVLLVWCVLTLLLARKVFRWTS